MKTIRDVYAGKRVFSAYLILALALTIGITASVSSAATASTHSRDYFEIKGGYYYPSQLISLDEFSGANFERKKGFDAEIAFGHHFVPLLGLELGLAYIEDSRFPSFGEGRSRVETAPVLLSAKLFLPIGPIEPYAEIGGGAYFSKLELGGGTGGNRTFRDTSFGPHAGIGLNINFGDAFFLGVEGRYRRVKPDFDGVPVRLDGYTATANIGFRY